MGVGRRPFECCITSRVRFAEFPLLSPLRVRSSAFGMSYFFRELEIEPAKTLRGCNFDTLLEDKRVSGLVKRGGWGIELPR